jgi:hypothetical protein
MKLVITGRQSEELTRWVLTIILIRAGLAAHLGTGISFRACKWCLIGCTRTPVMAGLGVCGFQETAGEVFSTSGGAD